MEISGKVSPIKMGVYINNIRDNSKITNLQGKGSELGPDARDKVDLSETAREMQEMKTRLDAVPDIRGEKVEEIKNRIENETYQIDAKKIAIKMIRDSMLNGIV
ncbi:MAG: flagellar biosynthesis anti-sigma factor FlgM [Deltaproteobacteria bacterium]|nr:MAG: flagellar biosynthesis anti-sigma factor FlgM [Deltaproteobacteria bacterium]